MRRFARRHWFSSLLALAMGVGVAVVTTVQLRSDSGTAGGNGRGGASVVVADGAVAFWRLSESPESKTAVDASGHRHDGTYEGAVQLGVPGAIVGTDSAANFDNGAGWISVPADPAIRLNGGWSVEFWLNQNRFVNTFPTVMTEGDARTADGYLIYATPDGKLSYKHHNNEAFSNAGAVVTGAWQHIALTYDGKFVRWYVNGALDTAQDGVLDTSTGSDPLLLGTGDQPGSNRLDEIAFYGSTLTPEQVANHYAVGRGAGTAVAPGPPTNVQAIAGTSSAGVHWTPPVSDGGTPVTGYRVTVTPGGATIAQPGWATSAQPDGLTVGTPYTFTVEALNAAGSSPASRPSDAITPTSRAPVAVLDAAPGGWPMYTHDPLGSGDNTAETALGVTSAPTVTEKWHWDAGSPLFAQPAVGFDGVFVGDNAGNFHRISLTGDEVWTTFIGQTTGPCLTQGVASSAALATLGTRNVVYVGGGDATVYALDAATGDVLWKTALGDPRNGGFAWTSPMLLNDALYVGYASLADCPLVPGSMVKLDPATGRVVAVAAMSPTGCNGGGIWGSPTFVDETLFVATGTEDPCPSPTPLEISVVALDPASLKVKDSWHLPETDQIADGDFGSVPTVFDAPVPGTSGKLIVVANKNGVMYAFDRINLSAGPVWTIRLAIPGACAACGEGTISPASYDGTFIFTAAGTTTSRDGATCHTALRALRPVDGSIAWEDCRSSADDGPDIGPVTVANGVVVFCEGQYVNGVAAASGARLFSYRVPVGAMFGGPVVSNGVIYAGGVGQNLHALAPAAS